jgi:hypothetical protein
VNLRTAGSSTARSAATVILALRRQWRLAAYLLVTGAGTLWLTVATVLIKPDSARKE